MPNCEPDFRMRELARTGLSPADQKELLASLSNAEETRARYLPAGPPTYVDRERRFLMHTFSPPSFGGFDAPPGTPLSEPVLADCALGIIALGWVLSPGG